jgi:hypothetical protein
MDKPDFRDYPNSPEGLAAYDAATAEYNRIQKGPMIGTEFVDTVEDVAGFVGEQVTKIPLVRRGLQFLGGAVRTVDQVMSEDEGVGGMVYRTYKNVRSAAEEGFGDLAENLGVDPRIGSFAGGEVVDTLATAGLGSVARKAATVVDTLPPGGMSPQLATVGNMATPTQLTPQIRGGQVFMSTTSPEYTAKSMGQGVAKTPKFAPAVKTYTERGQAYADAIEQVQSNLASGKISESRLKKTLAKIEKIRKGDASTFEYDPANPYAYREGIESSFNPYVSTPEYTGLRKDAPRGVVSKRAKEVQVDDPYEAGRKAQQHHILAKAETKPFADTLMDLIKKGVADEDDLVNFFVWPEQYDMFPGNVLNNLLDMGEITHTVAKKDPMALHKILKEAGLEFGSGTEKQIIKNYGLDKVTNTDELMQAYDRYLQEIAIPSKEITYKVHDMWYDKTVKQLKGAELKEFKEKYSKLSDPRKNR